MASGNSKSFLMNLEDKWYGFLDSLNSKGIPVYAIIDPIDKIVPSFYVFSALILALLLGGAYFLLSSTAGPQLVEFEFFVVDSKESPVSGAVVSFSQAAEREKGFNGLEDEKTSDKKGLISIKLFPSTVSVTVSKQGFKEFEEEIDLLDEGGTAKKSIELRLEPKASAPQKVSITVRDARTSQQIKKRMKFSFKCTGSGTAPNDETANGSLEVNYPENCDKFYASVSGVEGYKDSGDELLDSAAKTIRLNPIESSGDDPEENIEAYASLEVYATDSNSIPLPNVSVSLSESINGIKGNSVESKMTDSSGTALFSSLEPATYVAEAFHPSSGTTARSGEITLNEDDSRRITLTMDISGAKKFIYLKFIDSNSLQPIQGVTASVFQNKSKITNASSDEKGEIKILWADDANTAILAAHSSYVSKIISSIDLKLESESFQEIKLDPAASLNSGSALVKVMPDPTQGTAPVAGAEVYLYASGKSAPYAFSQSNDSGTVSFINLPLEKLYAIAVTSNATGKSDENQVEKGKTAEFTVFLDNPAKFNLRFLVEHENGSAAGNALVELIDKSLGQPVDQKTTDSSGLTPAFSLPAGRSYYARISKEDYLESIIVFPELLGNNDYTLKARIYSRDFSSSAETFFEGYYPAESIGNYLDMQVEKNKSYYAGFSFAIPDANFSGNAISHFRIDKDEFEKAAESEVIFSSVKAAENGIVYLFDSFDNSNLFRESGAKNYDEIKSANVKYSTAGKVFTILTKFYVRTRAHSGLPKIPLFHEAKSGSSYSEEKKEEFLITSCDSCPEERFTYSFSVDGRAINPEASLKPMLNLGKSYLLGFTIKNETGAEQKDLMLEISNVLELAFQGNPPGEESPDMNLVFDFNESEMPLEALGDKNTFSGEIELIPKYDSSSAKLLFDLDSLWHYTDFKQISFNVVPASSLSLTVGQQELLDRQVSYYLSGKVFSGMGLGIKNALVKFDHVPADSATEIHETAFTDENGFFEITLNQPLFAPAPLIVSAEAAGYLSSAIEIPVKTESGQEQGQDASLECIKITPEKELELTRADFTEKISIESNCGENFTVKITTVASSDLKISLDESEPAFVLGQEIELNTGEEKEIIIIPNNFLGIHPLNLQFDGNEGNSFSYGIDIIINPAIGLDDFELMGRDGGEKRYEFNLFNSIDKIRANYLSATPDFIDPNCSYSNLNACPPWVAVLELADGKSFNPETFYPASASNKVQAVYNKVFFEEMWPGIGKESETGILADASLGDVPLATALKADSTKANDLIISIIKFGIGSDVLGVDENAQPITELKLKLTAKSSGAGIVSAHYLDDEWQESDLMRESFSGISSKISTEIFSTDETIEGNEIIIDLLNDGGIFFKGIYSIAVGAKLDGKAEFFSADSTLMPACLIVNGKEFCGKLGGTIGGDCYFDEEGQPRQGDGISDKSTNYWGGSFAQIVENYNPSCVYCIDGEDAPLQGCYGDARNFFYDADGTLLDGFYPDSGEETGLMIGPAAEAMKILKENCVQYENELDHGAHLKVYRMEGEEENGNYRAQEGSPGDGGNSGNGSGGGSGGGGYQKPSFYTMLPNPYNENAPWWMPQRGGTRQCYLDGDCIDYCVAGGLCLNNRCNCNPLPAAPGVTGSEDIVMPSQFQKAFFAGNCVETGCSESRYCDTSTGRCVECINNSDCVSGEECINNACVPSGGETDCTPACTAGFNCVNSQCVPAADSGEQIDFTNTPILFDCDFEKESMQEVMDEADCNFAANYPGTESSIAGGTMAVDDDDNPLGWKINGTPLGLFYLEISANDVFKKIYGASTDKEYEFDFEKPGYVELKLGNMSTGDEMDLFDGRYWISFMGGYSNEIKGKARDNYVPFLDIEKMAPDFEGIGNDVCVRKGIQTHYQCFGFNPANALPAATARDGKIYTLRFEWAEDLTKTILLDGSGTALKTTINNNRSHPLNPKTLIFVIGRRPGISFSPVDKEMLYKNVKLALSISPDKSLEDLEKGTLVASADIPFEGDPRFGGKGINFKGDVPMHFGVEDGVAVFRDVKVFCNGAFKEITDLIDFREELDEDEFEDEGVIIGWNNPKEEGRFDPNVFEKLIDLAGKTCDTGGISFYVRGAFEKDSAPKGYLTSFYDEGLEYSGEKFSGGGVANGWTSFSEVKMFGLTPEFPLANAVRFKFEYRNSCVKRSTGEFNDYISTEPEEFKGNDWYLVQLTWDRNPRSSEESDDGWSSEGNSDDEGWSNSSGGGLTKNESPFQNASFKEKSNVPIKSRENLLKALFADGEKTKFRPGEKRNLVDIDLVNKALEESGQYGLIAVMDYGNDSSTAKKSIFHAKFTGAKNQCVKQTPGGELVGTANLDEFKFALSDDDYKFVESTALNRCDEIYCDSVQFLEKIAWHFMAIGQALDEGQTINSDSLQGMLSFKAKLKYDGLSRDLVDDFASWSSGGFYSSQEFQQKYVELFSSSLIQFRLLDGQMNVVSETSDSQPYIELPGPGTYAVQMHFSFKSGQKLFVNDELNADKITVSLRKIDAPLKDSLIYYLPFDSSLGENDGTRTGYGLMVSGDAKEFFGMVPELDEALVSLEATEESDFSNLNYSEQRGSIVRIERNGDNAFLATVSNANPNPVLMVVKGTTAEGFNGFYSLSTQNSGINPAAGLAGIGRWTGIGSSLLNEGVCAGFEDNMLPRSFSDMAAQEWASNGFETGLNSQQDPSKAYGIAFKRTDASGNFNEGMIALYSMIFTPATVASPKIILQNITPGSTFINAEGLSTYNSYLPLNFNPVGNNPSTLEDAIALVNPDEPNACIYNDKDKLDLFWNEDGIAFNSFYAVIEASGIMASCLPSSTVTYTAPEWGSGAEKKTENPPGNPPGNEGQNNNDEEENSSDNQEDSPADNEENNSAAVSGCIQGNAKVKVSNIPEMNDETCDALNKQAFFALMDESKEAYVGIYHRWVGVDMGAEHCAETLWNQTWKLEAENSEGRREEFNIWNTSEFTSNELVFDISWKNGIVSATEEGTGEEQTLPSIPGFALANEPGNLDLGGHAFDSDASAELLEYNCEQEA